MRIEDGRSECDVGVATGVLAGAIPKELSKLTALRVLDLHHNKLSGELWSINGQELPATGMWMVSL